LQFVLAFGLVSYALAAVVCVTANGNLPAPSFGLIVQSGLWVFAELAFYFLLGLGIASLIGSRAYTIGILLAWRTIVSHILVSISALGTAREAFPDVAFNRLAPSAIEEFVRDVPQLHASVPAAVVTLLLWTAIATAVGAWRTATRDV
jgi:hypothetical protein